MDKSTLSNYGWIVIAVLVLAVMIALATPFGTYIKSGVESTTAGLFDTSEKAMNVALKATNSVPQILDGENQTYDKGSATTPLIFRSNADIKTFKEVKIDGETVAKENYTVTSGSTIITFTDDYSKSLENGNHTIEIISSSGVASTDFNITHQLFNKSGLTDYYKRNDNFQTIDGVDYFYYHCGPTSFKYAIPNSQQGSVTITIRIIPKWGYAEGQGTSIICEYTDGTTDRLTFKFGKNETITFTTPANKTLSSVCGNYDYENWVLLDLSVMSIIANY